MVEGPLLHRLAFIHRELLLGHAFTATSPTGRFADGAAAIDGHFLTHIEVHGKNMFYFFTPERVEVEGVLKKVEDDAVVVHIHLGMAGSFRTYRFPGPVPREATRLRLHNEELGVEEHLSASVCEYGNIELYRKKILELGPDPLREDADRELLWASMQKTNRSIGAVLMDQSLVAGIGNIYRAEILFVVGLHPDQPANTISRAAFEFLWEQAVRQMKIGVEVGNIITILPEDADKPLRSTKPSQLRYVYNQKACGKCGGVIKVWTKAQRSVYACEACQPPPLLTIPVSKRVVRKDEDDSKSAVTGDGISEKMPSRKKVAKGGRVVVHQAYKEDVPSRLPESFVVPSDQVVCLDKDGGKKRKVALKTAPMSTDDDKPSMQNSSKPRGKPRGRRGAGSNQADQSQTHQRDAVNGSAPLEKPMERCSAHLRKQAVAAVNQGSTDLGFRGKLEFLPPRVASLSVQSFPASSARYAREPLSICASYVGSSSIKFPCATSARLLMRPLGSAQPVVKVAAFGSIFLGSVFLQGSVGSVIQ